MLNKFVEINNRNTMSALVLEEHLQLPQFIEGSHIYEINHEMKRQTSKSKIRSPYRIESMLRRAFG